MDDFLENAQLIFEVAQADASGAPSQFALLVRDDGGLHFIMESPVSIEGASACAKGCLIEERRGFRDLLRDQPLYVIASPLLTASS
jgi:hypothetical protein